MVKAREGIVEFHSIETHRNLHDSMRNYNEYGMHSYIPSALHLLVMEWRTDPTRTSVPHTRRDG